MNKVEVAIVGTGEVANTIHLPSWKNIKEAEVKGICDINRELAQKTANKWNISHFTTDFEEMIQSEDKMLVDICTPPSTHKDLAIKAMREGHDVLLEKPMAMSPEDADAIMRTYKRLEDEVNFCIIHNFLFELPILKLRSLLEKNGVEILGVDIRMLHTPNDEMISDRNHWVHDLPGGRFGECMIHPVYVLSNLIGELKIRDVYAVKRGNYDWVKYDELFSSFDSGDKFGSIHVSFNSPRWTFPMSLKVYGEESIIGFDGSNQTFMVQGKCVDGYLPRQPLPKFRIFRDSVSMASHIIGSTLGNFIDFVGGRRKMAHELLFRSFIDQILYTKAMPYTVEEAYRSTKVFHEIVNGLN